MCIRDRYNTNFNLFVSTFGNVYCHHQDLCMNTKEMSNVDTNKLKFVLYFLANPYPKNSLIDGHCEFKELFLRITYIYMFACTVFKSCTVLPFNLP